jgi:hypothetical protein
MKNYFNRKKTPPTQENTDELLNIPVAPESNDDLDIPKLDVGYLKQIMEDFDINDIISYTQEMSKSDRNKAIKLYSEFTNNIIDRSPAIDRDDLEDFYLDKKEELVNALIYNQVLVEKTNIFDGIKNIGKSMGTFLGRIPGIFKFKGENLATDEDDEGDESNELQAQPENTSPKNKPAPNLDFNLLRNREPKPEAQKAQPELNINLLNENRVGGLEALETLPPEISRNIFANAGSWKDLLPNMNLKNVDWNNVIKTGGKAGMIAITVAGAGVTLYVAAPIAVSLLGTAGIVGGGTVAIANAFGATSVGTFASLGAFGTTGAIATTTAAASATLTAIAGRNTRRLFQRPEEAKMQKSVFELCIENVKKDMKTKFAETYNLANFDETKIDQCISNKLKELLAYQLLTDQIDILEPLLFPFKDDGNEKTIEQYLNEAVEDAEADFNSGKFNKDGSPTEIDEDEFKNVGFNLEAENTNEAEQKSKIRQEIINNLFDLKQNSTIDMNSTIVQEEIDSAYNHMKGYNLSALFENDRLSNLTIPLRDGDYEIAKSMHIQIGKNENKIYMVGVDGYTQLTAQKIINKIDSLNSDPTEEQEKNRIKYLSEVSTAILKAESRRTNKEVLSQEEYLFHYLGHNRKGIEAGFVGNEIVGKGIFELIKDELGINTLNIDTLPDRTNYNREDIERFGTAVLKVLNELNVSEPKSPENLAIPSEESRYFNLKQYSIYFQLSIKAGEFDKKETISYLSKQMDSYIEEFDKIGYDGQNLFELIEERVNQKRPGFDVSYIKDTSTWTQENIDMVAESAMEVFAELSDSAPLSENNAVAPQISEISRPLPDLGSTNEKNLSATERANEIARVELLRDQSKSLLELIESNKSMQYGHQTFLELLDGNDAVATLVTLRDEIQNLIKKQEDAGIVGNNLFEMILEISGQSFDIDKLNELDKWSQIDINAFADATIDALEKMQSMTVAEEELVSNQEAENQERLNEFLKNHAAQILDDIDEIQVETTNPDGSQKTNGELQNEYNTKLALTIKKGLYTSLDSQRRAKFNGPALMDNMLAGMENAPTIEQLNKIESSWGNYGIRNFNNSAIDYLEKLSGQNTALSSENPELSLAEQLSNLEVPEFRNTGTYESESIQPSTDDEPLELEELPSVSVSQNESIEAIEETTKQAIRINKLIKNGRNNPSTVIAMAGNAMSEGGTIYKEIQAELGDKIDISGYTDLSVRLSWSPTIQTEIAKATLTVIDKYLGTEVTPTEPDTTKQPTILAQPEIVEQNEAPLSQENEEKLSIEEMREKQANVLIDDLVRKMQGADIIDGNADTFNIGDMSETETNFVNLNIFPTFRSRLEELDEEYKQNETSGNDLGSRLEIQMQAIKRNWKLAQVTNLQFAIAMSAEEQKIVGAQIMELILEDLFPS